MQDFFAKPPFNADPVPHKMKATPSYSFDFVVLGGGSAGYAAARTAHSLGLKTAVIDGADELGGLCILKGCMPSKSLIESANRARAIRHAGQFGIRVGDTTIDAPMIVERKRRLIGDFASYRQGQLDDGRFDLIRGRATLIDPHTFEITPRHGAAYKVTFATACLATGSVHSKIDLPGLESVDYWTSDDILEATEIPESAVVLGGGAIALEMACYLEGLGSKVTLIQRSEHLLTGSDVDLAEAAAAALRDRGMAVHTGTTLRSVERNETGLVVHYEHHGEPRMAHGERLLLALGRQPASAGLGAEEIGLILDRGRVPCDSGMATRLPHIFAAGDLTGPHDVVHTAIAQGEAAAHNAAFRLGRVDAPVTVDYRLKLLGIFSDPEIAMLGLTEAEAAKEGRKVITASYPFNDHGKSMIMGADHGFVKMIADANTKELVGASVVGPHAVDLIHEVVVALHFHCTAGEFLKIPHYHPTLSEIWTYPAEELAEA